MATARKGGALKTGHDTRDGKGLFITLEGEDGVGKTTQIELLRAALEDRGLEVVCLHEPGGTALGEKIRGLLLGTGADSPGETTGADMDPLAELLLFEAARAQLVAERIRPTLARGAVVVCDRFTDSTIAYQGYGRELGAGLVERLNEVATGGLQPDVTILLAMGERAAQERVLGRRSERPLDRMEQAGGDFRAQVHQGFLELAAAHPERIRTVDAAQPVDKVHEDVMKRVASFITSTTVNELKSPGLFSSSIEVDA